MTNKFPKEKFEQVAAESGYEVFTPEQIASYYKEGIEKSMNDQMSEAEKKEFVADCMYLSKAVLVDKDGAESTVYFRKSQVDWEKAEDGTIMKGVAGVYADTPANRLLGRVGEAYIPDDDFMKSLDNDTEDNAIAKAARTGRYADTPENRRLHRVGQPYKKRASKSGQEGEEKPAGKKSEGGKLDEKTLKNLWASLRTIDDEDTWDDAIRTHFGDKVADSLYDKDDGELLTVPMFKLAKKLPVDVIKRCIEEVGTEPEDGDTPYPGEAIYGQENKTLAISLNREYYKLDKFLDNVDFEKLNDEQKKAVNQARRSLHESNKPLDDRKQMATVWAVKGGNPLGRGLSESDIPKIFQETKENFKNVREMLEKVGLMDSKK